MSKLKKEKVRNPKVVINAIAIDEGYYKNRIIRAGEHFLFDGEFEKNNEGEFVLASWLEPASHAELAKLSKAATESLKKKAPAANKPAEKPAKENAASVMAAPELV